MEESEDLIEDLGILEKDEAFAGMPAKKDDSRPTKVKVAAFKNRVFHLLTIFVEKTKDLEAITGLVTEETFMKDPTRMRELILKIVNRTILPDHIINFAGFYKNLLLFKHMKDVHKFSEDFVLMLRKLKQHNEDFIKQIVQQMLETFILKRKCKLNVSFFFYLLKRMPALKSVILEKGLQIQKNKQVRPAQQRVLEKLMKNLSKSQKVKQEHLEEQ